MLIFLIALIATAAWISVGMLLFRWKARPVGTDFQRSVHRSVLTVGSDLTVTLRLTPPPVTQPEPEPNDVVLILDHSGSMGDGPGSALWEAARAAENFVRHCPAPIHIGLIGFDQAASILSEITANHSDVLRSLSAISADGGTSIHTALATAGEVIQAAPDRGAQRTAILLSDGGSNGALARAEADRLRDQARIVTIGFSDGADMDLLRDIAGSGGHVCHVEKAEDLSNLFGVLASFVSGRTATTGLVHEPAHAPAPFRVASTGSLHPVGLDTEPNTDITWSVPVVQRDAVAIDYDLVAECAGWHSVARQGGQVTWRLPDDTQRSAHAPDGPHVLVLPPHFEWAWPVLNPLFWLIFGRLFCQPREAVTRPAIVDPEPLAFPSLPKALEPPQPGLFEPTVKSAMIIGIGETGEWAVCHLKRLFGDRRVAPERVSVLAVRVPTASELRSIHAGAITLDAHERIDLEQDFRPYLETFRNSDPPSSRRWIPFREWLARIGPRTTVWARDRRAARLALLRRPNELESSVHQRIEAMKTQGSDATVVVVGSAEDPECSGLLAEIAHVIAIDKAECTAVITVPHVRRVGETAELEALARELERMVLMRGDDVLSDRQDPPVAAKRMLDRIVVLRSSVSEQPDLAGKAISEIVWDLLAYPQVLSRVPTAKADVTRQAAECCVVEEDHIRLPVETLWELCRGQALARAVNGLWLGLQVIEARLESPLPPRDDVTRWVSRFWSRAGLSRPQSLLVHGGGALSAESLTESSLLTVFARLPVGGLYEEQAEFANRERLTYTRFIEEWSQALLGEAYNNRRWGLTTLLAALREIEEGVALIQRRLRDFSGNARLAPLTRLATALYSDLASWLEALRQNVERWVASIIGSNVALGVLNAAGDPLCMRIELARRSAELNVLFPTDAVRDDARRRMDAWYQAYGAALIQQFRFRFVTEGNRARVALQIGKKEIELATAPQLLRELDDFMSPYRAEVLSWPLAGLVAPMDVRQAGDRFGIGASSRQLFPGLGEVANAEDPHLGAAVAAERVPLMEALGVSPRGWKRLPYTWPEEANAARLAALIHNVLERQAEPLSPTAVHLLRDTDSLRGLFADLADLRVQVRQERCWLTRDGVDYEIGGTLNALSADEALARFEGMVRQAAVLKRSVDGKSIPDRSESWPVSPEDAVRLIEATPLVQPVVSTAGWRMWRDIIRGVVLDSANEQ